MKAKQKKRDPHTILRSAIYNTWWCIFDQNSKNAKPSKFFSWSQNFAQSMPLGTCCTKYKKSNTCPQTVVPTALDLSVLQ